MTVETEDVRRVKRARDPRVEVLAELLWDNCYRNKHTETMVAGGYADTYGLSFAEIKQMEGESGGTHGWLRVKAIGMLCQFDEATA